MSRKPGSSIFYDPSSKEYALAGRESLKIRLFFCPVCGRKQRPRPNAPDFWQVSQTEERRWKKRLAGVTSIQMALRELGPPDEQVGPWVEDYFPGGLRVELGVSKALFYNKLARTFTIAAIEWRDGRFEVKHYPKARGR